ncbi:MAG: HU family DNA-binding protein [Proteobacteria bacterium]|nr:HU family DNA-binding protein [Pseudomonadota bacterium]
MTKAELLAKVSEKVEGLNKKQANDVVNAVFDALSEAICTGNRFSYPCFGTFTVKDRAARKGRNPRTNAVIDIAASRNVSFKAAPKLKDALNAQIAAEVEVKEEVKEEKCAKKACKKAGDKADKKATKKSKK